MATLNSRLRGSKNALGLVSVYMGATPKHAATIRRRVIKASRRRYQAYTKLAAVRKRLGAKRAKTGGQPGVIKGRVPRRYALDTGSTSHVGKERPTP